MERKAKRKSPGLASKLKKAVEYLHVDVFGYQSKVTKNIITYFSDLSKETGIPRDRLILRIFKDRDSIYVGIHHKGRQLKSISVSSLIRLFTDVETSVFF